MEKDLKTVLQESGFNFKKKFGQNFLTDKNLLSSIAAAAGVEGCDTVIEIGCGAGTLTRALADRAKRVIAFDVDRDLQPVLAQTLSGYDNVEVVFKDFLRVDLPELEKSTGEYKVVANLPYYITTPLIMKIFEQGRLCKSLTLMVQEEVAERLCARANTPEYGAITAVIALKARAEIIKRVPRTMFIPRPNVDSAVVRLTMEEGLMEVASEELYKKCVHAAFLSRRKTLVNNIINAFSLSRSAAEGVLKEQNIDLQARGETLTPEDFAALTFSLAKII